MSSFKPIITKYAKKTRKHDTHMEKKKVNRNSEIASEGTTMLVLEKYFNVTTIKMFKNLKETIFKELAN